MIKIINNSLKWTLIQGRIENESETHTDLLFEV